MHTFMYLYMQMYVYVYVYTAAARKNARATFADGAYHIAGTLPQHTSTLQLALKSLLAPTPFMEGLKNSMLVRESWVCVSVRLYLCV